MWQFKTSERATDWSDRSRTTEKDSVRRRIWRFEKKKGIGRKRLPTPLHLLSGTVATPRQAALSVRELCRGRRYIHIYITDIASLFVLSTPKCQKFQTYDLTCRPPTCKALHMKKSTRHEYHMRKCWSSKLPFVVSLNFSFNLNLLFCFRRPEEAGRNLHTHLFTRLPEQKNQKTTRGLNQNQQTSFFWHNQRMDTHTQVSPMVPRKSNWLSRTMMYAHGYPVPALTPHTNGEEKGKNKKTDNCGRRMVSEQR